MDRPFFLFARQELTLAVRSRWTQIFAAVFAALALAVAASGYILSGGGGVQDFSRTAASLVQLVLLLVPLTSLSIGVLSLAPDKGGAELLFSQPVSRKTILLGRLLGLFAALAAAQGVGLGAAGVVIFLRAGQVGAGAYALLFAASLALTAVFLGVAAALSSAAVGRRARSLAVALIVWFAAVVLFDVAALGAATQLRSGNASRLLIAATLINPVDAVRTGTLLAIEGTTAFGPASLALLRATRGAAGAQILVALSVLFWTILSSTIACRRLSRTDL
ncbi:MAG TPA: ABC transporter permease subunit [Thermoanaerobaculia bacterium]|nr:ABC transporter permease subunit [Thermoanaerobaculia bacterium]